MGDYGNAMMRNPIARVQYQAKAQGRANNAQLKLIAQNHPTGLTTNLLKLFEPGPPLEYKSPAEKRQFPAYSAYSGIAQFVTQFAEPGDSEYAPSIPKSETRAEKRLKSVSLSLNKVQSKLLKGFRSVWLVIDKETKKPRGYAFIEYVHTRDMKNAYKHADGIKVDSRRVVVDVERGRTVPNWRPRRLGGGLGLGRFSGDGADHKHPSREQQLAGHPRSEEPRTRRDDHHADRDLEKSCERMRERNRGERTSARSHERTRDRELRGERYSDKDRDMTREKDQVRDRERDRDHDRDRRDKDKHRYHGRDYDRGREHEGSRDRHGDRERAGHKRGRDQLNEYYQEDPYGKMPANYQARPNSIEPVADEKVEEYTEGDYKFHQADN